MIKHREQYERGYLWAKGELERGEHIDKVEGQCYRSPDLAASNFARGAMHYVEEYRSNNVKHHRD